LNRLAYKGSTNARQSMPAASKTRGMWRLIEESGSAVSNENRSSSAATTVSRSTAIATA